MEQQQQTSAGLPSVAELDNDTRGWIMCIVSGIACVLGASIICVDVVVRQFPGRRDFRIENSNVFLACSLSLSFGVMLFSALYSMLPSARQYLERAGLSGQAAGLILMTCFVAGFLGIQAVSRVLHQFMPSHVVDCDHSHDEPAALEAGQTHRSCSHGSRQASRSRSLGRKGSSSRQQQNINGHSHDHGHYHNYNDHDHDQHSHDQHNTLHHHHLPPHHASHEATPLLRSSTAISAIDRRPSILQVQKRVMSFVRDTKSNCDEMGPCYGYTDPCGQECFKHLPVRAPVPGPRHPGRVSFQRTTTGSFYDDVDQDYARTSRAQSSDIPPEMVVPKHDPSCSSASSDPNPDEDGDDDEEYVYSDGDRYFVPPFRERRRRRSHSSTSPPRSGPPAPDSPSALSAPAGDPHHHHVPTNAFMSIGLQTSIAIALHKFPEGFITYATNHANPALGFAVFMALFVHNISEGFAMALPLYMALGSRARAMAWATALGGLSQPLGAGLAVLWFRVARRVGSAGPGALFYAGLFAVTAGIMVSVALQLFVESLSLNHNRNLSTFFGFLGMALLGFSGALVGDGH